MCFRSVDVLLKYLCNFGNKMLYMLAKYKLKFKSIGFTNSKIKKKIFLFHSVEFLLKLSLVSIYGTLKLLNRFSPFAFLIFLSSLSRGIVELSMPLHHMLSAVIFSSHHSVAQFTLGFCSWIFFMRSVNACFLPKTDPQSEYECSRPISIYSQLYTFLSNS